MAIIDPDGLFNGDRFRRCSNAARLHWPYFFLASNGFGRIEINYYRLVSRAFTSFDPVPSETEIMRYVKEYQGAYLLFLYEFNGQVWGQWDCPEKFLKKFKTATDKASPEPPKDLLNSWRDEYQKQKKEVTRIPETFLKLFGNVPEIVTKELPLGVGVGVGVGNGVDIYGGPQLNALPDYEYLVLKLIKAVPKGRHYEAFEQIPMADRIEAMQAVKVVSKAREIPEEEAYQYLLKQALSYAEAVARWGKDKFHLSKSVYEFFHSAHYAADDQWEMNTNAPDTRGGAIRSNKTTERIQRNRETLTTAFDEWSGRSPVDGHAGPGSEGGAAEPGPRQGLDEQPVVIPPRRH